MKFEVSTVRGIVVKWCGRLIRVKSVAFRGYDELLCNHVYYGFCQNCPRYKCGKRCF